VLACLFNKDLLDEMPYSEDVKNRARFYIESIGNDLGAYSESKGYSFVRNSIKNFIEKRDGFPADANNIYLVNGASDGIQLLMSALFNEDNNEGMMIPIPQYPLYSALLALKKCEQVHYYLDESRGWEITPKELEKSYENATKKAV
jgi:aspartate/methionine/tyrosine aminotransferase